MELPARNRVNSREDGATAMEVSRVDSVQGVLELLRERGYRRTPQRECIVEILWESDSPLTAREVHQRVRQAFPHVSLDTVYRNLELLREAGLVSQINLQSRESARFELLRDGAHHHHLVCLACGDSFCLPVCPVDLEELERCHEEDFVVVSHAFELYGYCKSCRP